MRMLQVALLVVTGFVVFMYFIQHDSTKRTCWAHSSRIRACYTQRGHHCTLKYFTPDGVIGGTVPCKHEDTEIV